LIPPLTRKGFLAGSGTVAVALGAERVLGPAAATASRRRHAGQRLSAAETATLVAWCDLLVPGARENDVGRFVNAQLAKPDEEALLMLRYLTWPPPFDAFYRSGMAALDAAGESRFGRRFVLLTREEQSQILAGLLSFQLPWTGPPQFPFYLATRGDAVDVVYGTEDGFARLDFPYMPLVEPPRDW
jgi:hypothetical protein